MITLTAGTYVGNFTASGSGTSSAPIALCGTSASILDGGDQKTGYALHLSHANWWQLYGFSAQHAQKGVVLDHANHNVIDSIYVYETGQEAIHLRAFSSDNTVRYSTISNTGLQTARYGEGIYVGSANSNWCAYTACKPDRSDRNLIQSNAISHTSAESLDIKEGTTGGVADSNHFSGVGMVASAATAWVNVKGNAWTLQNNVGTTTPRDGFQVHQVYKGWGLHNTLRANRAGVNASGWGYYVQRHSASATVYCSNTQSGAAAGLTNVACTPG